MHIGAALFAIPFPLRFVTDSAKCIRGRTRNVILSALVLVIPILVCAQATPKPAPQSLNWSDDDSSRIAWLEVNGRRIAGKQAIVWAPPDSLSALHQAALVDSIDVGLALVRRSMGQLRPWQRIANRPVRYYFSTGRFIAHASGNDAVFIPVNRVLSGLAPYLHEAAHELLAPTAPFYGWEYADSVRGAAAARNMPLWLFEGVPDYLAQSAAQVGRLHEGDVFAIGGLAKVDSVCAARALTSPRRDEILRTVGATGQVEALFTTERAQVAPIFYACAQSMTKLLVETIGVQQTVDLFPAMQDGTWEAAIVTAATVPLATLRQRWLVRLGLAVEDSTADTRSFRAILDDFNVAWQTRDAAQFVKHFAPDADFMQAFGRYRATKVGAQDFMAWFLGGQTSVFQSRELSTRVTMLTPDAAFVEQQDEGEGIQNSDGTLQPGRRGNMMLMLVRRNGRWWIRSYRYLDIHTVTLRR